MEEEVSMRLCNGTLILVVSQYGVHANCTIGNEAFPLQLLAKRQSLQRSDIEKCNRKRRHSRLLLLLLCSSPISCTFFEQETLKNQFQVRSQTHDSPQKLFLYEKLALGTWNNRRRGIKTTYGMV